MAYVYYNGYHLLKDHNPARCWSGIAEPQAKVDAGEAQDAIGVMRFAQGEGASEQQARWRGTQPLAVGRLPRKRIWHHVCIWSRRRAKRRQLSHGIEKQQNRIFAKAQYQLLVAYSTEEACLKIAGMR